MLVAQPLEDATKGVPLLGRRLFIVSQDLLDDGVKIAELDGRRLVGPSERLGLGVGQHFANFASRMVKRAGDGANRHAIAMGLANTCILVHREHPWLLSS